METSQCRLVGCLITQSIRIASLPLEERRNHSGLIHDSHSLPEEAIIIRRTVESWTRSNALPEPTRTFTMSQAKLAPERFRGL